MSSIIEALNRWGNQFVGLAWPIFWQSSVLILVVLAVDLVLRNKLRAAVRYALWLVVLLKLTLPASLALPTGLSWWLPRQSELPLPAKSSAPAILIEQNTQSAARVTLPHPSPLPLRGPVPEPTLSTAAWRLVLAATVGVVLFGLMCFQWYRVSADIRQAASPWEWLVLLFRATCKQARVRWPVRLRLTRRSLSPALCGLVRPVVLLPGSLATDLSQSQLRAVLFHELMHLRRGDVLVSFLQALLQIVYWWHPLV